MTDVLKASKYELMYTLAEGKSKNVHVCGYPIQPSFI